MKRGNTMEETQVQVTICTTLENEIDVTPIKQKAVTTAMPLLQDVKDTVLSFERFEQDGTLVRKRTHDWITALSFNAPDCSLATLSAVLVNMFRQADVWPKVDGKWLNTKSARRYPAGRLFNKVYSLAAQRGIVDVHEGTMLIKVMDKPAKELLEASVQVVYETDDKEKIKEKIKDLTPMQRRDIIRQAEEILEQLEAARIQQSEDASGNEEE